MLGNIIGAFIVMIIAVTLIPVISDKITQAQLDPSNNLNGASKTILGLVPLFFGLAIATVAIGMTASALSFNSYSNDYEEENKDVPIKQRPHKQTYLEYVQERLAVEKLMHRN